MTSKAIKDRAQNFCLSISGKDYAEQKELISEELEKLYKEYKLTTVRTVLTEYRKFCTSEVKHLFAIKENEQIEIVKAYRVKIAKQSEKQVQIKDFEKMISRAKELLSSSRLVEVATALTLLTGRRISEILCTAKFSKTRQAEKLHFVGQLKKKDSTGKEFITIYSLETYENVKKAMSFVREQVGTIDTETANRRYTKTSNQVAYKNFSEFLGDCTTHDLRKAYAAIIAHLYKPQNKTLNFFLSENLGHSETDLNTANIYQKYFI